MRRFLLLLAAVFSSLSCAAQTTAGQVLASAPSSSALDEYFCAVPLDSATIARMREGGSLPAGCPVSPDELRYLRVLHYNYDEEVQVGEMVCNRAIAADLLDIFRALYVAHYPIARMVLIDDYHASDSASMADNNTSCFCCRPVAGSRQLSRHATGRAVDINPLDNPCVSYGSDGNIVRVVPDTPAARQHISRSPSSPHIITTCDLCYLLFAAHGFAWGGAWHNTKDYQHFEK